MATEKDRVPLSSEASHAPVPAGAVFLSYASEDAAAAQQIATALRNAGIEVWFDKSELRGGDAWDRQIRRQIHECALFVPVVSAHSDGRHEGYFRREWRLAVERAGDMAEDMPFLLPVVIDATKDATARVPDRFREVQWSHLPEGAPSAAFIERVRRLLTPESAPHALPRAAPRNLPISEHRMRVWSKAWVVGVAVVAAVAIGYLAFVRFSPKPAAPSAPGNTPSPVAARFNPPPHSVAVLPFVNMSGDKEQEYFSDGLTEELLNSLSRINELQVAARTSSFSFQGEHPDIAAVAHKLNVAAILEGSVRRSAHTVRITAQLVNGVTGFHVWSQTYDRDLGDVLQLQTDIATAVASALKVTLLGDEAAKIEVGGTRNPAAFDAYLRATKTYWGGLSNAKDVEAAIAGYTEAIRLDPDYALAYSSRALAINQSYQFATTMSAIRSGIDKALADARKAIALAPDMSEGHQALARAYEFLLELPRAKEEHERALALGPNNARALRNYGAFATNMGRGDSGLTSFRRALVLDPLNVFTHGGLGESLVYLRRYPEAIAAFKDAEALDSSMHDSFSSDIGGVYLLLGDFESAQSACEKRPERDINQLCLAVSYEKLGRHPDAEAMLAKARASDGDTAVLLYSMVYAQWGDTARALDSLETAMRLRSPDLIGLKHPFFDPLRKEPRFQAIERALKFPD